MLKDKDKSCSKFSATIFPQIAQSIEIIKQEPYLYAMKKEVDMKNCFFSLRSFRKIQLLINKIKMVSFLSISNQNPINFMVETTQLFQLFSSNLSSKTWKSSCYFFKTFQIVNCFEKLKVQKKLFCFFVSYINFIYVQQEFYSKWYYL